MNEPLSAPVLRLFGAAAAAAALAALAPPAFAASGLPADALAAAATLAAGAAAALAPAGGRIAVQPGTLDSRLTLAPCARIEPYLAKGQPTWGRTRVGLRCNDGAVRWSVFVPLTVQVWAPALVSSGALPAGAQLSAQQLTVAEVDWAAGPQPPFAAQSAAQLAGRTLVRPLAAGQALRPADLQPRQWFAIGDTVQVHAFGSGFAVQVEGRALTPGYEGQPARVRVGSAAGNGQPGRDLSGRPVAEGKLALQL